MGFAKLLQPHNTTLATPSNNSMDMTFPLLVLFVGTTSGNGQKNNRESFDQNVYYGFDFNSKDSQNYLAPLPTSAAVGNNITNGV